MLTSNTFYKYTATFRTHCTMMHGQQNIKIIDGVVGIRIVGQLCRRRIYLYIYMSLTVFLVRSVIV
jgi:hypothetical protein